MTATHRYSCACGIVFSDQINYEQHLWSEHNRLRDLLPVIDSRATE
jgi:hypothetical protein